MRVAAKRAAVDDPSAIRHTIETYLAGCRDPVLVEEGEPAIEIDPERCSIESGPRGCLLHVWSDRANLVRRVRSVTARSDSRLELRARRFGRADSALILMDRSTKGSSISRAADRAVFKEFFRRMLAREFKPGVIEKITCAADLERSLSPLYTRGIVRVGNRRWAVIGASREIGGVGGDRILTFGLIWLDLVMRGPGTVPLGLKLFVPKGRAACTAQRLNFLTDQLRFELFEYDRNGNLSEVDPADHGNLETRLTPCLAPLSPTGSTRQRLDELLSDPRLDCIAGPDGVLSLRARGIEFARLVGDRISYGLDNRERVTSRNFDRVGALAREILRLRSPDSADRANPLFLRYPERWLDSQVRRAIQEIDPAFEPAPLYSHVPAVSGHERGIIDLLARDIRGRLTVLELKASEDIHLPLQGLDYWLRVKWHLERDRFVEQGYFSGGSLGAETPRLMLLAPALDFHPTTEAILQFFAPAVPVERIGVSTDWRRCLRVEFRRKGAHRLA